MPKPTQTADDLPGLLGAACVNLEIDADVQLPIEGNIALAQAQATLALAIAQNDANRQQARTADALELANLIQARHMGIYNTPAEYRAVEHKLRELLGLEGPRHD